MVFLVYECAGDPRVAPTFRGAAGDSVAGRYNRFACKIQFYLQNIVSGAVFVNGVGG